MSDLVRTENRTDYAGAYTAYIYSDGHVETDPPGRPQSREDTQRLRLQDASRSKALQLAQAQRARHGLAGSTAPAVVRENAASIVPRVLLEPFHEALDAMAALAPTARTNPGMMKEVADRYSLGGPIVGDRAGTREENVQPAPPVIPGAVSREPTYATEG
ncbi:MAG TPA: hypothetical protein VLH09_09585 [Bryobacteraceae bacterium]|nr:hypothetical protein [Bryobacteraceae bacterium]